MLVYDTNARRYFAEWFGTREEYDNLPVKANNTKYCVREVGGDASFYFFGYDDTILEGAKRDGTVNVKDLSTFDEWIGTEGEFSAITNRRGNTKYAVTNNNIVTNFVKVADKPDNRISLSVAGGPFGLELWNNPNDPMPIKTINMNGLQKWEETDDYIIYLDKDAVMTTVANYVTGTYDLFLDRKADIDGSVELLRANDIEWTAEDDSKLILDINKAQLERIANTPTTMEDEDFAPQTFETRAVPTTYEACFRVDKKSGEIYIGEGYENLWQPVTEGAGYIVKDGKIERTGTGTIAYRIRSLTVGSLYNYLFFTESNTNTFTFGTSSTGTIKNINIKKDEFKGSHTILSVLEDKLGIHQSSGNVGDFLDIIKAQITQTSTPKPFVKSIMPSGKLAFVTGATSESHSFVMKGMKFSKYGSNNANRFMFDSLGQFVTPIDLQLNTKLNLLFSKNAPAVSVSKQPYNVYQGGIKFFSYGGTVNGDFDSFTQLLIYKGNLTEAELIAENEKDIRLK